MLKAIIDSLDSVDEHFRSLYTERDGKFELTGVEGMKTEADVQRLQTALSKEREDHRVARTRISAFGELEPEDVLSKLDRLQELELTGGTVDETKMEEIIAARLKTKVSPLERTLDERSKRVVELETMVQTYESGNRKRTVQDKVREAFAIQKLTDAAAQEDAMLHAMSIFTIDADTNSVVTEDGRTPAQWLEGMKQTRSYWWGPSHGGGSFGGRTNHTGTNPWAKDSLNLTEQGRILKVDPSKAEQLAKAAGVNVFGQPL